MATEESAVTLPITAATAESPDGSVRSNQNGPNQGSSMHDIIRPFLAVQLALLQVNSQANKSLFVRPVLIEAFIVTIAIYFLAGYAKEVVKDEKTAEIIGYIAWLFGFLSNDLLLIMLTPILGWIGFGIWLCCLFAVTLFLSRNIDTQRAIEDLVWKMLERLMGGKNDPKTGSDNTVGNPEERPNSTNASDIVIEVC